jgi:Tfp pilus assembly protein PilO
MPALEKIKSNEFIKQLLSVKAVILAVGLIVAVAALVILNGNINTSSQKIKTLRQDIQKLTLTSEAFSTLARDYQILSPYLEAIRNLIPNRDKVINFNQELSELAEKYKLDFGFIFQEAAVQAQSKVVSFTMTLKGNFSDFVEFLVELKTLPYFVDLDSFNISGPPIDDIALGVQTISIVIKGKVFMQLEETPSPSPTPAS